MELLLYRVPQVRLIRYREQKGELGTGMCGVEDEGGSKPVSYFRVLSEKGRLGEE